MDYKTSAITLKTKPPRRKVRKGIHEAHHPSPSLCVLRASAITLKIKPLRRKERKGRPCQEKCVNGYVCISRLEPVCQIVWQTDLLLVPNF